jgi:hypothetical protein
VVAPKVGALNEQLVADTALDYLRSTGAAERMMGEIWRAAGTIRVARREPQFSRAGKVLPLRVR